MVAEIQAAGTAPGAADLVARLAAADGTAAHGHVQRLSHRRAATRDLSDAVHALCAVHGHHPDLIEIAASLSDDARAQAWFGDTARGFAAERVLLAQLTAAAGPLPSTPGQGMTAAALNHERHTLEMLARSERHGVALGAAAALIADWTAVRTVLANAADRFGVEADPAILPDAETTAAVLATLPAAERAIAFGAQQLFAQHRGLWSLLEARTSARGHSR